MPVPMMKVSAMRLAIKHKNRQSENALFIVSPSLTTIYRSDLMLINEEISNLLILYRERQYYVKINIMI